MNLSKGSRRTAGRGEYIRDWILRIGPIDLSTALTNLLGAETADAVETEGENDAIFLAQAHVETRKLDRRGAAVPRMSECHCRTDQRTVASSRPLLKIEKERRAAKKTTIAIAEEHRRTPLRTTHSSRFKTTHIREANLLRSQLNRARVIKTLKYRDGPLR